MLALSRRVGEAVTIGDDITVTVLQIRGGQVRLGICAPGTVPVHREEIAERIGKNEQLSNSRCEPASRDAADPVRASKA